MATGIERLEEEFKGLAPNEQAELLECFAKLVCGDQDEDPAFLKSLKRRIAQIDSGEVKGRNAFEVLDEIEGKHSR